MARTLWSTDCVLQGEALVLVLYRLGIGVALQYYDCSPFFDSPDQALGGYCNAHSSQSLPVSFSIT